jgi:hypothetical protein
MARKRKQAQRPWTAEEIAMLGKATDAETARILNRTYESVQAARRHRKIPAFRTYRRWTSAELALLGTIPDAHLGRMFGRSQPLVSTYRKRMGIAKCECRQAIGEPKTDWTAAQLQILENNGDDLRVAQLTGKRISEVRAKRNALAAK